MDSLESYLELRTETRTQTETLDLVECNGRMVAVEQAAILLQGSSFPSLQRWSFGLLAKKGVSVEKTRALAAQIKEHCDGMFAHFNDHQPSSNQHYEKDEWGLAILDE